MQREGIEDRCIQSVHRVPGFRHEDFNPPAGPQHDSAVQHVCSDCRGSSETISEKDKCGQCKGQKVVQDKKLLEVHVEKGYDAWTEDHVPRQG